MRSAKPPSRSQPVKRACLAEVLAAGGAAGAVAAGAREPGNARAVACAPILDALAQRLDGPDGLVARDDGEAARFDVTLADLEVGAADGAGGDAQQQLAGGGDGVRAGGDGERAIAGGRGAFEQGGAHGSILRARGRGRGSEQSRQCLEEIEALAVPATGESAGGGHDVGSGLADALGLDAIGAAAEGGSGEAEGVAGEVDVNAAPAEDGVSGLVRFELAEEAPGALGDFLER